MGGSHSSSGAFNATLFRDVVLTGQGCDLHNSSVTFEGVMKEYFYRTGMEKTEKLMEAAYSIALDTDPFSLKRQIHLALGLHSSEDGKNERRDLNLVIVLDISGSMNSKMSSGTENKITVANQVLCEIVENLKDFERLGIVLFNEKSSVLQSLTLVQDLDKKVLKETVMGIKAGGGTNFTAGMQEGINLFSSLDASDSSNSNRIIYLTDACPNIGGADTLDVLSKDANCGPYGISSTFIGVGLDFNSEIVEGLTKTRGCNYFTVKSNEEFKKILNEDFNYIVTPLCFDVKLIMESDEYEIEQCFGTNMAHESTNEIMKVDTCCAGQIDERGVKGGIILVRLKQKSTNSVSNNGLIKLTLSYQTIDGRRVLEEKQVSIDTTREDNYYETSGIRKAIALVRYVELVKGYLKKDKTDTTTNQQQQQPLITSKPVQPAQPVRTPSPEWNLKFKELLNYFTNEKNELGDEEMKNDVQVISKLIEMTSSVENANETNNK